MASKSTAVAKKEPAGAVAAYDYGQDQGAGFENMTNADLSIPFLSVVQSNSKIITEEEREGAKAGMFYNTVTRELVDGEKGLVVVPVHTDTMYVERVPFDDGGGFIANHETGSDFVKAAIAANDGNRFGKIPCGPNNAHELIETHYVYVLILDDTGERALGFAVIGFSSTKIKPKRDWYTAMRLLQGPPPIFANRARVKTSKESKNNQTYHNIRVEPLKDTWLESLINPQSEAALLTEAKNLGEMVAEGTAKAAFETQDAAGDDVVDDKTPF